MNTKKVIEWEKSDIRNIAIFQSPADSHKSETMIEDYLFSAILI